MSNKITWNKTKDDFSVPIYESQGGNLNSNFVIRRWHKTGWDLSFGNRYIASYKYLSQAKKSCMFILENGSE